MPYCTQQDLVDRFGEDELIQLTDRANVGAIDQAVLDRAIADAGAEIDGYLAGRYALPLATVPTVLVRLACDITRYFLYDKAPPEQVAKRYDDAARFLRSVAKGEVALGADAAGVKAMPSDGAQMESGGRIFGRDQADGFI